MKSPTVRGRHVTVACMHVARHDEDTPMARQENTPIITLSSSLTHGEHHRRSSTTKLTRGKHAKRKMKDGWMQGCRMGKGCARYQRGTYVSC